ncbi:MAG: sensor histidine kinase, partial [Methyloprofundus sp.]|nr:sensor histidine kinase [Methyloprofundus sp.]
VAETLNKRREMMIDILLADLIPQLLLVVLISVYLFKSINRGLWPLNQLANQIAHRSPRDLSPIVDADIYLEVKTLTDTINQLFERLNSVIASQQRFIANAAHQLRTPLAGLKLQAEVAQRENNLDAMQPALRQIQSSADRISHLITQLLTLARSEQLEGRYKLKPIDLRTLVRDVCIEWVPKALLKQIDLSFDDPDQAVFVQGDALLLMELLSNLIDNAIAYGAVDGKISVKLIAGPQPCLQVQDNGIGIPDSERERIFERFYRISDHSGNGCGLGLAIVKEIADLHQAQVQLINQPDKRGTIMRVIFQI